VRQRKNDANVSKTSISKSSPYNRHITNLNNGSSDYFIHLQRTIGNQAVQRRVCLKNNSNAAIEFDFVKIAILQPKLKISQPGDAYEQEADKVADQVLRMADSSDSIIPVEAKKHAEAIDRKCTACEMKDEVDEEDLNISRKPLNVSDLEVSDYVANEINNVRSSGGSSLDSSTRDFMESRFGYDFSTVRIHADERATRSAQWVNALAYTAGNDIVFGQGHYQPSTLEGRRLLAHELTHVVQQTNATTSSYHVQRAPEEKPKTLEEKPKTLEEKPKTLGCCITG
jgi:hypothetical protein